MENRTVAQFKRLGVATCQEEDLLCSVATRMADHDISGLVVVDGEGYLSGIITRTDVLTARLSSPDWIKEPVSRFMTRSVVTVFPDTILREAVDVLVNQRIHRVVVVRQEAGGQRPIAVVSDSDLICEMADQVCRD